MSRSGPFPLLLNPSRVYPQPASKKVSQRNRALSDDDRRGMVFGSTNQVRELFDPQRPGVLATPETHRPYLSLMAFAATPDLTTLVVATSGMIT